MGMEFAFAAVPYTEDGDIDNIFALDDEPRDGVIILPTHNENEVPGKGGLGLNVSNIASLDDETNGAFLDFTDGTMNQRYVLISPRRGDLARLRQSVGAATGPIRPKFLEIFVENAEAALQQHGDRAALIIF